jgi:hypothetical protein
MGVTGGGVEGGARPETGEAMGFVDMNKQAPQAKIRVIRKPGLTAL